MPASWTLIERQLSMSARLARHANGIKRGDGERKNRCKTQFARISFAFFNNLVRLLSRSHGASPSLCRQFGPPSFRTR